MPRESMAIHARSWSGMAKPRSTCTRILPATSAGCRWSHSEVVGVGWTTERER